MRKRTWEWAVLLGLIACSTQSTAPAPDAPATSAATPPASTPTIPAPPPTPAQPDPPIQFTVTHLVADDAWEVRWKFREPTAGILFDRRQPANRHETWKPGDNQTWVKEGEHELIKTLDGKPANEFSARFPSDPRITGRAPPLNVHFTDGSRLLFTAQVGAHALEPCTPRCDRRGLGEPRVWQFRSSDPARTLRVTDTAAPGALTWNEPRGDVRGTYLYSGSIKAIDAGPFAMVVDPGLPAWLADATRRVFPELFKFHSDRTGIALDFRPVVFAARTDPNDPGQALHGRTLPAVLQLAASGDAWSTPNADRTAIWFEFLAHESFHLWNAQLARRSPDQRDEWISEGSSMYQAALALRHAGLLDEPSFTKRITTAASACMRKLKGPLFHDLAEPAYYDCGQLVHFLVDRKLAGSGGVHAVLAATFEHARKHGHYATADWLAKLDSRAGDPAFMRDIRQILDKGLGPDPAKLVQRLLKDAGLDTDLLTPPGGGPGILVTKGSGKGPAPKPLAR